MTLPAERQLKVFLDTDIGSNIDDALCLAYLLARDDCDLIGITTVSGEADRRAMLASTLCWVAEQAVPIVPGAEAPLKGRQTQPHAPQAAALLRWPHQDRFPRVTAVDFMRQAIRSHPGEVVLLAIGPLTNVALLFDADPEIPSLLRALVIMGGVFTDEHRAVEPWERNTSADPHAAAKVYAAPVATHRSVGLDVTRRMRMPADGARRRLRGELLGPVREWAEVWFENHEAITFNDPLAAATLFDEAVCRFARGTVDVEISGADDSADRLHALTSWSPGGPYAPHEVAVDVDTARFLGDFWLALG